jgi:intracellular septation protein
MKFLFDLFPVILFFVVYKWGERPTRRRPRLAVQYLGGLVSGGKPSRGAGADHARHRGRHRRHRAADRLPAGARAQGRRHAVGVAGVIVVFGGATIYFHDENFIKWKPTILYWAFALALLVSQVFFGKNLMRKVMEEADQAAGRGLAARRLRLDGSSFAMGVLNLLMAFVVFKDNTGAWVSFKVFGITGIFFAFIVGQTLMLSKHIQEEA